jgi:hypothetical protein
MQFASERSRRFSDSKFRLERDVAGRRIHAALDSLEKQLHRLAAQLARRLRHHGEAGVEIFRPCEIVVSDDADGLWAGDTGFAHCRNKAEKQFVIGAEDCGRGIG